MNQTAFFLIFFSRPNILEKKRSGSRDYVSGALTRVRVSRTIKGARVSIVPEMKIILVFRLVASLGKYALENKMRIYALI